MRACMLVSVHVCIWREAGAFVLSSSLSPSDIKHGSGGLALRLLHSHTRQQHRNTHTGFGTLHINSP